MRRAPSLAAHGRFELESATFWELINKWFVRSCTGSFHIYLNLQPLAWKDAAESWTHKYSEKFVFRHEIPAIFREVPRFTLYSHLSSHLWSHFCSQVPRVATLEFVPVFGYT